MRTPKRALHRFVTALAVAGVGVTLVGCGSSGSTSTANNGDITAASAAKSSNFGSLRNVCHPATGANRAGKNGVTARSVRVTTISDAGSTIQKGLNQELWDTATVFTRWCNEHGGINGRKITLIKGNAQVTRYNDVINQSCDSSFALVGGGGALDGGGQTKRVKCGLVALPGFVASPEARGAPLSYPALGTAVSQISGGGLKYLKAKYGADEPIATVSGDFDTTQFTIDQRLSAAESIGLASQTSPVNTDNATYPITGLPDWRPTAKSVIDSGATGLLFSGQPPDLGKLLTALAVSGSSGSAGNGVGSLKWAMTDENMYDQTVIQNGRTGLAKLPLYVQTFVYPFEEAGKGAQSRAMDEFLALFQHYLPNGKSHAMFAVSGFASWLLFAQAASSCGDVLTRACLVTKLKATSSFDAGGLIAPRDPSRPDQTSQCFALMKATPKGFVRVDDALLKPTPGIGNGVFNCGQDNIMTVTDQPSMKKWQEKVAKLFGPNAQD